MSAQTWRRTPPATGNGFWTSPPSSERHGEGIKGLTIDGTKGMKKLGGDVFTGVSVRLLNAQGTMGVFAVSDAAVRWSGRKLDVAARPILGEVVDSNNNKQEGANWTILFSKESIKSVGLSNDQTNHLEIVLDDAVAYSFVFRNPIEASAALRRFPETKLFISKSVVRLEKKPDRRRSIAFDDVLEEEESHEGENVVPGFRDVAKLVIPEAAVSSTRKLGGSVDELRQLVRKYCSFRSTEDQVAFAAQEITNQYGYALHGPNRDSQPIIDITASMTEKELRTFQNAQIMKVRPALEEMRDVARKEKDRIENQTKITVVSPSGSGRKIFEYRCALTGNVVSPKLYAERYLKSISMEVSRKRKTPPKMHIETAFDVSSILVDENGLGTESTDDADPSSVAKSPAEARESTSMTPGSSLPIIRLSAEDRFAAALRDEEVKLHRLFDDAIDMYMKRKKELEREILGL